MTTHSIDGWEITPTQGTGKGSKFEPIPCFVVVGPYVRTETRVDASGLKDILPEAVYSKLQKNL